MRSQLVVFARAECHLCQEMIDALKHLQKELPFDFEVIDIDGDSKLRERFNEKVPVLMALDRQLEICHYYLDIAALNAYLANAR